MMKTILGVGISAALLLSACGGATPEEKFAADFCDCMGPLVEMQEKIQENPEEAMSLMGEMQELAGCAKELEEKYREEVGEDLPESYKEAVKEKCPKVFDAMEGN